MERLQASAITCGDTRTPDLQRMLDANGTLVKTFQNRMLLWSMQDVAVKQKWLMCEGD